MVLTCLPMQVSQELYNLTIDECAEYLHIRIEAEQMTRQIAEMYLAEVADACAEMNCRRLLLERDVPTMLNFADLVDVTKDFLKMVRGVRVAFVNPHTSIDDQMNFAVMFGSNRGGLYSLHSNVSSGIKWLLNPRQLSS